MKEKNKTKKNNTKSRREFLKTLSRAAASVFVVGSCKTGSNNQDNQPAPEPTIYGPRAGISNPFVTNNGDPILVCVTGTDFNEMLQAGLETIGGLGRLVSDNQNVLVKPNLNHRDPYPGISSPNTIADIVREIKQVTSGEVYVGDEGWEGSDLVYPYLDLESFVSAAGGNLIQFSEVYHARRDTWPSTTPNFRVFTDVYDSPIIISTCLIKRHGNAALTCAIKCNVGTVQGSQATATRRHLHQSSSFMQELAEIAGLVNPELTIVDARSILTQGGPMIQDGVVVDGVNKVIICGDLVATDAYCARIMEQYDDNFSVSQIEDTLQRAEELGLGTSNLGGVEIIEFNV
jgi:uncharacterized protein (DUF362 family)